MSHRITQALCVFLLFGRATSADIERSGNRQRMLNSVDADLAASTARAASRGSLVK